MNAKPSDFFLNIIDFFGIVIPGVILYLLYGDFLFEKLDLDIKFFSDTGKFALVFGFAYIFGHFLFGFSVWLNKIAIKRLHATTKDYYKDVSLLVTLPSVNLDNKKTEMDKMTDVFYSAFSYLRLNSPNAMAELERQAAEYKLFRSLTLLFILDFMLNSIDLFVNFLPTNATIFHSGFSFALAFFTFLRFDFLFDWTYRLTYDFYLQVSTKKGDGKAIPETPDQKSGG